MKVYGISQSSGVERRLTVERGGEGIVLTFTDHKDNQERERIMVSPDELLSAITEAPSGGTTIEGVAPPHGGKMSLAVEIRGNEVLLAARPESGSASDAAVGLDDLQDALESVLR